MFGSGGTAAQPAVDGKSSHPKIGELTLENDFLEGALTKAGRAATHCEAGEQATYCERSSCPLRLCRAFTRHQGTH